MSRIRFIALTALAVSGSGCTSLRALDQAATDLANQTPTCTQEPAVGVDNYGGKTCTVLNDHDRRGNRQGARHHPHRHDAVRNNDRDRADAVRDKVSRRASSPSGIRARRA